MRWRTKTGGGCPQTGPVPRPQTRNPWPQARNPWPQARNVSQRTDRLRTSVYLRAMETHPQQLGTVTAVRGSVVDVRFDGTLSVIHSVLHAGADERIVIEVLTQRNTHNMCAALR